MSRLSRAAARLGYTLDNQLDALQARLRRRLGYSYSPLQIVPFRTYGTAEQFFLAGRVLENPGDLTAHDDDTLWDNLLSMYRRFNSKEVGGAVLRATYAGVDATATTDAEGYFQMRLHLPAPLVDTPGWVGVDLTIENAADFGQSAGTARAEVLIPPAGAAFGVISDIDDTVVVTHAPHLVKMAAMVFLNNARTRLPFPGVAGFYQALHRGRSGSDGNPLFFVSSSAWNLYDLLVDFMALNGIPPAPILLADYGANESGFLFGGHQAHKIEQITRILQTYPTLSFILIGDSGQKDPEIYQQVVQLFPGRILAIYIRDVTQARRDAEVAAVRSALGAAAVDLLLEADTLPAARHAAAHGWIDPAALEDVHAAAHHDEAAPTLAEAALTALEEPHE